jgi:hypothetical protein
MSRKIQIVLPDPQADQLAELAANAGEPPSTHAALLVRNGIVQAAKDGKVRLLRQAPVVVGNAGGAERARWLEPYGSDPTWRHTMWGQVVALHGRYPRALAHVKDHWWTDEQHTEILCALATWRTEIDDSGTDPREELAFHNQLQDYAHTLQRDGGSITKAWAPGAPPYEWAGR